MSADGVASFHDRGVAFRYPQGWELEVADEGGTTTVSVHSDGGPAFALVTLDGTRPDPTEVADQALEAMREEYPGLDAVAAPESIAGHPASGYDAEFLSLDMNNSCAIRCFRTPRRTVLLFGQWSDLEGEDTGAVLAALRASFAETDG